MLENINAGAAVLFLSGALFLIWNLRFAFKQDAFRDYLESSPRAALWRARYGTKKAIELGNNVVLPLWLVLSVAFAGWGLYYLLLPIVG